MITFESQEAFEAAVMAAVERYLKVAINLKRVFDYETYYYQVNVSLTNSLAQTQFSKSEGYT